MASATSDFRPLTFSFRFKRFVSSSERNVFPPLPETFRFLQRLQCFLQRFTFRSFRFLDPLVFISFQGAAAAAAGRGSPPPPGAGVGQTVAIPFHEHGVRGTRWYKARGAGGLGMWGPPAPALSCSIKCYSNEPEALDTYQHTRRPRRPEGAADFPCLRQLPPPPFKR